MAQVSSLGKPSVSACDSPLVGGSAGSPGSLFPFLSDLLREQEKQNFVGLLWICC